MKITRSSKLVAVTVLASVLLSLVPPAAVIPKAQAIAVPTLETNPALLGILPQDLLEWAQTFVLATLKRRLLDMMVDQIIQWIQGGGKPQFVTDWSGFLRDAGNQAAGDFAQEVGLGFLCQPFNFRVQISLLPVKRFSQRALCTLDQIVGNIQNFYNDFRNGGWIAYTGSLEPQNNYFGATIIAYSERNRRVREAKEAAQNEAVSAGGWLSTKKCDASGKNCVITTPGDTIGSLVSKAVGSDIDFILSAEQLGDYAAAIANALINRLIVAGVSGLQGVSTRNAPPPGGIPPGTTGNCAGLTGAALTACRNYITSTGGSFTLAQNNLTNQIDQTLTPLNQAQTALNDSIQKIQNYDSALRNLLAQFQSKNPLTCPLKNTYIASVNAELQWASSTLPSIQSDQSKNQINLNQLTQARSRVTGLAPNDWTNYTLIATQIQGLGLDPIAADNFKSSAEAQNTAVGSRVSQNLQTFNQNLASCP